ncbi:MAG: serine/threonine protein kinase [Nevskiaceae bacterium]|nr:MAG: serine/threonine protein kinase [Nevskiaceae bacterium]
MQKIGKFELGRLLGKGGQSAVYLAHDTLLQRDVALKLLRLRPDAQMQRDSLLREARTASRLQHPRIVPIYEAGEHQGQVYLVFEYVEGRTLDRLIRDEGAIDAPRAAAIMRQILDAIAHAHAAGVIHRDLKPSNILIDRDGQPRVMDFGIATPASRSAGAEDVYIGTPSYMAPEYIARRLVTPQYDVFSAGLMLYEMLTGARAVDAGNTFEAMHRIANAPLVFPPAVMAHIADGLHEIVLRAAAKDPALRFQTAEQMRDALAAYLNPATDAGAKTASDSAQSTLEFLLRRMKLKSDFPAMSSAIGAIQRMTRTDKGDVNQLSNVILKDVALTNKILRLVNSAYYPMRAGNGINTVSRAVVMMGLSAVSGVATSLLLFEHLKDKKQAGTLQEEFLGANLSAIIAAELGARLRMNDTELVYICAVFHNLGRLLAHYYFPEEADTIGRIVSNERCDEDAAARRVLGISYQDLGIGIARHWGFPDSIVNGMRRLPAGRVTAPKTADEKLRLLSAMAGELRGALEQPAAEGRAAALNGIAQRYGEVVPLGKESLTQVLEQSSKGLSDLATTLNVNLRKTRIGDSLLRAASPATAAPATSTASPVTADGESALAATTRLEMPPAGEPAATGATSEQQGLEILAAGIQDISQALIEDLNVNDLLRIIAETIFRAIGVRRVLICLRDGRSNRMGARFGYGERVDEVLPAFAFNLAGTDLFNLVLSRDADVLIHDAAADKVRRHLPAWYLQQVDAPTFIVFPVCVKGVPVAMIYADHERAGAITVSEKELALLRTLRNQAVMAIRQAR